MRSAKLTLYLLLAATLALPRESPAQLGSQEDRNPEQYASVSGRWQLTVDPEDRFGKNGAAYELRRLGKLLWSGKRPFALWEAVVAENGTVAGYSLTDGDLWLVILAPDGSTTLTQRERRRPRVFRDAPPYPLPIRMVLDERRDRFLVQLADVDGMEFVEQWRVYQLSTGKRVDPHQPGAPPGAPGEERYVVDEVAVPGTPLRLRQRGRYDGERSSAPLFTLLDRNGQAVWQMDFPPEVKPRPPSRLLRTGLDKSQQFGGLLRSGEKRRFDVHLGELRQRITFSVHGSDRAGWKVREVRRQPYPPEPVPVSTLFPERQLRCLGAVSLDFPEETLPPEAPPPPPTGRRSQPSGGPPATSERAAGVERKDVARITTIAVGRNGDIYAAAGASGAVHQFDRKGRWLRAYPPLADEIGTGDFGIHLTARRDGHLIVRYSRGSSMPRKYVHFSPDARRVSTKEGQAAVMPQPVSDRAWEVSTRQVRLYDGVETPRTNLLRRPDRRWLRQAHFSAVGPDGTLVVIEPMVNPHTDDANYISLYRAGGEPIRTLSLPPDAGLIAEVVVDARRVLAGAERVIYALSRSGRPLWRFRPPEVQTKYPSMFLHGGELLVWDGGDTIHRYRLP